MSVKEKEKEKKKTYLVRCKRVDINWKRMTVKTKKKKRKETLTGRRSWSQMVVDADGGTHRCSGGAVDDSARVSLYLRFLCEFAQPHITNLLPNIGVKY